MRQCEYCYEVAVWLVETARGPRAMCQRHYNDHEDAWRSVTLSSVALADFLAGT